MCPPPNRGRGLWPQLSPVIYVSAGMGSVRAPSVLRAGVGLAALVVVLVGSSIVGVAGASAESLSWSAPIALGVAGLFDQPASPRVACPSTVQCTALDSAGQEVTFNPSAPADMVPTTIDTSPSTIIPLCPPSGPVPCCPPSGPVPCFTEGELPVPLPIACVSVTQCTTVDGKGREVTFDPSEPGNPVSVKLGGGHLSGVACPSVSQCTTLAYSEEVTFNPLRSQAQCGICLPRQRGGARVPDSLAMHGD